MCKSFIYGIKIQSPEKNAKLIKDEEENRDKEDFVLDLNNAESNDFYYQHITIQEFIMEKSDMKLYLVTVE
jgi:hypothetical protein